MYFFTFIDKCNLHYLLSNPSLLQIEYPFYVLSSNVDAKIIKENFPNSHIFVSENNMQLKLLNFARFISSGIIIKIDSDAIIYNYREIVRVASETKPQTITGNLKGTEKRNWIRGGCHIMHSNNFNLDLPEPKGNPQDVDIWIGTLSKLKKVEHPLFEQSKQYSGILPCWHPEQNQNKMNQFNMEMERWKNKR